MKSLKPLWALGAVLLFLLVLSWGTGPPASTVQAGSPCIITETGDLMQEIQTIGDQMPGPDSNGMVVPTAAQMAAWEDLIRTVDEGELAAACNAIEANGFPYHIVRYTDSANGGASYLLLKENLPLTVGWGAYVIRVDGFRADAIFEVPHPACELHTEEQGVELFRRVNARALLVAGTHRCANTTYSPCDGTTTFCGQEEPHRTSDVAHATQTMFYAAHQALVVPGQETVAVQIHGCAEESCPDLFISNTTCTPGDLAGRFYANARRACAGLSVDVADCVEPECPLVGRTNVQGRYSNGVFWDPSFDACTEFAPGPSQPEQFLHFEQSPELRQDYDCLVAALQMTLLDISRVYVPVAMRGHTPEGGEAWSNAIALPARQTQGDEVYGSLGCSWSESGTSEGAHQFRWP